MAFAVAGPAYIRCARAGSSGRWRISLPWFGGPIGLPVHTVGRGCDAASTPDASRCRFTTATAPASALVVNPSSPAGRVTATIDRLVRTTLVRFRVFVRPCSVHRSRRAVAGVANPATIPLRRFLPGRHPPARACALAVFRRLAPALLFFRVAGAAARVIRHRFPISVTYRARRLVLTTWADAWLRVHRRSWGSLFPSQP
jgi:hypothetical protein